MVYHCDAATTWSRYIYKSFLNIVLLRKCMFTSNYPETSNVFLVYNEQFLIKVFLILDLMCLNDEINVLSKAIMHNEYIYKP